MTWQEMVARCFGVDDGRFGFHETDRAAAIEMVEAAKAAGASRDAVREQIILQIEKRPPHPSIALGHLEEQLRQLNKFWPV